MRLFDFAYSGNCHKVKLLASILSCPLEIVPVDLMAGEHLRSPMKDLNPLCELPVFTDGVLVLRDSGAILVYLASRHGGEAWLPSEASQKALVCQWLGTAAANVNFGPALARGAEQFGYPADKGMTSRISTRLFQALETHLATRQWLELDRPTIADIAMFPYVAAAPEGGLTLGAFDGIQRWIDRIKNLPGYIAMPSVVAS
ncbi:MAG: glutathione S-transferase family protein [Gammaproteobacteria bacterium]